MGAALLAGTLRGLTGFGAALSFLPLAGLAYGAKTAMPVLWVIDAVASLPMTIRALGLCRLRKVLLLGAGALLTVPFGYWLLARLEGDLVQWIVCSVILLSVMGLAAGFRLARPPSDPGVFGIGVTAGVTGSLAGLAGPPIILFWLAAATEKALVRADIFGFFVIMTLYSAIGYLSIGLFTAQSLGLALAALPLYGLGLWLGAKLFHRASEQHFQRLALSLCAGAALVGLPLWR